MTQPRRPSTPSVVGSLVLIAASATLGYVRPSAVSITVPQATQGREAPSSGPPAPSPSPSASQSTCLNLGPIGLCLK